MYPNLAFLKNDLPVPRPFHRGARSATRVISAIHLIQDGVFDVTIDHRVCQDLLLTDEMRDFLASMCTSASVRELAIRLGLTEPQCEKRLCDAAHSLYEWIRSIQTIVITPKVTNTPYCPLLDARPLPVHVPHERTTTRLRNALVAGKLMTWRQLVELAPSELMALPNFGRNCLELLTWAARQHIAATQRDQIDSDTRERFADWIYVLDKAVTKNPLSAL